MRNSYVFALFVLSLTLGSACKSGSADGQYYIQQTGTGFGPGADKIVLDLRGDKTFDITAGPMIVATGTWKETDGTVELSQAAGAQMGTTYKKKDGKLFPIIKGKDITFWRWAKK